MFAYVLNRSFYFDASFIGWQQNLSCYFYWMNARETCSHHIVRVNTIHKRIFYDTTIWYVCLANTASFCRSPFILTPEFQRLTRWRTVARCFFYFCRHNNTLSMWMAYCFGDRMFVAFVCMLLVCWDKFMSECQKVIESNSCCNILINHHQPQTAEPIIYLKMNQVYIAH